MTDVTILMTTWLPGGEATAKRLTAIEEALASWNRHLDYSGGDLCLHVADDGSKEEDFKYLVSLAQKTWRRPEITTSWQDRRGLGASLNAGLQRAFERSPVVFHAVDDWKLLAPLDLTPWVSMLEDSLSAAAMIRFFPHPNLQGQVDHSPHGWSIRLRPEGYVFGFRPALWHRHLFETAPGSKQCAGTSWDGRPYFVEGVSALECERLFNERYVETWADGRGGGHIYLALPEQWRPIESVELSAITPGASA